MEIISFAIENCYSFRNRTELKFDFDERNAMAIFGPNGSGKTNFFRALLNFRDFVQSSTDFKMSRAFYEPFRLRAKCTEKPTEFTLEFEAKKHVFRYSYALLNGEVVDESLKWSEKKKTLQYKTVFSRGSMRNGEYEELGFTKDLLKTTRSDSLVLTRAFQVNNSIAVEVFDFLKNLNLVAGWQSADMTAQKIINDPEYKAKVLALLNQADLFIQDVSGVEMEKTGLEVLMGRDRYDVMTSHYMRDNAGKVVGMQQFNMFVQESTGTRRIFELAYPILEALERGSTLYIDEFETALHPNECVFLVELFKSELNKKGAKLIVNTHLVQLMEYLGYKNVVLFGKNNFEETEIGRIPGESRNVALEKKYLQGRYGAVPRVGL